MSQPHRLIAPSRGTWIASVGLLLLLPLSAAAANLASVTVNPKTVASGAPLEVTFTLDGPAPVPYASVTLTSDPPGIVTIPNGWGGWGVFAGTTSRGLVVQTSAVPTLTEVTLTASYGGVTRTTTVTVVPREPVRGAAGDLWADVILGQPDFGDITFNETTSRRVFNAGGVVVDRSLQPNRVYVFDGGNSRVLGMSHLGTCQLLAVQTCTTNSDCGANGPCLIEEGRGADLVLGQPSFDRSACNGDGAFQRYPIRAPASAASLCFMPEDALSVSESFVVANMAVDGDGNLYVPDLANNRVLRYNSPFENDTIADFVWGQTDFVKRDCNGGRGVAFPDNQSLCLFTGYSWLDGGVGVDPGGNLWVADYSNNRVLRFPKDLVTGVPRSTADLVLGQPDFTSSANGTALNRMSGPDAVRIDASGTVYVSDSLNHRVLIFHSPLSSGMTGAKLDFTFSTVPFGTPTGLELDPAGGIWVNDTNNNQLLLFVGGAVQKVLFRDVVNRPGCDNFPFDGLPFTYEDGSMANSARFCVTGGSVGVDDDGNVFASGNETEDVWRFPAPIPTPTPGIAHSADARLFKPYQYGQKNHVGPAGLGVLGSTGVAVAGDQLIVADEGRLLFWNNPPFLANGQPADGWLGTVDASGNPSPFLSRPPFFARIREDRASHLWAIRGDKILLYSLPLHTGDAPVATIGSPLPVLGGGNLVWDGNYFGGGIAPNAAGDKVWIADPARNRVFRIRNALTTPIVDILLGQTTVSGTACNRGQSSPSRTSLCYPGTVTLDPQGNLYVADHAPEVVGNFRLLEYDAGLFPDSPTKAVFAIPASRVFGTGGSFTVKGCLPDEVCGADFEPAFTSDGQMVVGGNGYLNPRWHYVYTNPLVNQRVNAFLNDFVSGGVAAAFDSSNNLYVTDGNRSRVLIYLNPLSAPPPGASTLTVTKTGGGTGTVKSFPIGIDCGAACSQSYIDGTSVALSTIPGTNSLFAGWSGNADCADGIVTMDAAKTCTATFNVKPDLIVSALTVPAGALAGSTFPVTDTTKNQTGTGSADASTTRFYFSTNTTLDGGDPEIGSRPVPILAPGAANTLISSVTIPGGLATGNYYIIAKADADNVLTESSETNNTKYAPIHVGPPDLIIFTISVPATGTAGTTITATNTTKNQTGGPAGPSTTKFYLSTNATLGGDVEIAESQPVGALAPGASEPHSTTLTIPAGTAPGTWYVIAKADADGLVTEANENNNTAYDTIVIGPDLIVSALTVPAYGGPGLPITVTDTTKNQGGGSAPASNTRYYLSTNATLGSGDVLLDSRSVGTLGPGASSTGSRTFNIPAGTALGSYYLLAVADGPATPTGSGAIPETVETNNLKYAVIKISPDLVVSVLTVPTSGHVGVPFTVSGTTKNSGQGIAGPSTTKFYLSNNATLDGGDAEIGSHSVPQLAYGATSAKSISGVTIPTSGTWYIFAKVDATGAVTESSETNNVTYKVISITP